MIIAGQPRPGDLLPLLVDGSELGLDTLEYACWQGQSQLGTALAMAEKFIGRDKVVIMHGDVVTACNLESLIADFCAGRHGGMAIYAPEYSSPDNNSMEPRNAATSPSRCGLEMACDNDTLVAMCFDNQVLDIARAWQVRHNRAADIADILDRYQRLGCLQKQTLLGPALRVDGLTKLQRAGYMLHRTAGLNEPALPILRLCAPPAQSRN